jgi:hypothetical protein
MIAGGFGDISKENSCKFVDAKATSNAQTEFDIGREPIKTSRPATTTRSGVSPLIYILESWTYQLCVLVRGVTRNWYTHYYDCEVGPGNWCSIRGILAFTLTST